MGSNGHPFRFVLITSFLILVQFESCQVLWVYSFEGVVKSYGAPHIASLNRGCYCYE